MHLGETHKKISNEQEEELNWGSLSTEDIQSIMAQVKRNAIAARCEKNVLDQYPTVQSLKSELEKRNVQKSGNSKKVLQQRLRDVMIRETTTTCSSNKERLRTKSIPSTIGKKRELNSIYEPKLKNTTKADASNNLDDEEKIHEEKEGQFLKKRRTMDSSYDMDIVTFDQRKFKENSLVIPKRSETFERVHNISSLCSHYVHLVVDPNRPSAFYSSFGFKQEQFPYLSCAALVHTNLYEAITKAKDGDMILLSEGIHEIIVGQTIEKNVEIIGSSFHSRDQIIIQPRHQDTPYSTSVKSETHLPLFTSDDFFISVSCGSQVRFSNVTIRLVERDTIFSAISEKEEGDDEEIDDPDGESMIICLGHSILFVRMGSLLELDSCDIYASSRGGVFHAVSARSNSTVVIKNCNIHDMVGSGLYLDSNASFALLFNNEISNNCRGLFNSPLSPSSSEKSGTISLQKMTSNEDDQVGIKESLKQKPKVNQSPKSLTLKSGYFASIEISATELSDFVSEDYRERGETKKHHVKLYIFQNNRIYQNKGPAIGIRTNMHREDMEKTEMEHMIFRFNYLPILESKRDTCNHKRKMLSYRWGQSKKEEPVSSHTIDDLFKYVRKHIHLDSSNWMQDNGNSFTTRTVDVWQLQEKMNVVYEISHMITPSAVQDQEEAKYLDISIVEHVIYPKDKFEKSVENLKKRNFIPFTHKINDMKGKNNGLHLSGRNTSKIHFHDNLLFWYNKHHSNVFCILINVGVKCKIGYKGPVLGEAGQISGSLPSPEEQNEKIIEEFWNNGTNFHYHGMDMSPKREYNNQSVKKEEVYDQLDEKFECLVCDEKHDLHFMDKEEDNLFGFAYVQLQRIILEKDLVPEHRKWIHKYETGLATCNMVLCKYGHISIQFENKIS